MAPIYRKIVLAWKGKEYTVDPSFEMVQQIESSGISIMGVVRGIYEGQPLASKMGAIIAHMLHSGGAKGVTPKEVYGYLANCSPEEWQRITTSITVAFLPQEPESGNAEALGDGGETEAEPEPETASAT